MEPTESLLETFFHGMQYYLDVSREVRQALASAVADEFSVFDYLQPDGLRLSRMITDLLAPKRNHGQGSTFLVCFVQRLHRGFEVPHHLQLLGAEVLEREFWKDGEAIVGLDHLLERFDATGFVGEIVVLLHLRLEFTQVHDLRTHAVSLLQQPLVADVDVVR